MSAETLRKAAALMRERAEAATPGPWWVSEEVDGVYHGRRTVVKASGGRRFTPRVVSVGQTRGHHTEAEENVAHIASMGPAVALALADLLDEHALVMDDYPLVPWDTLSLAVARTYLGEVSP